MSAWEDLFLLLNVISVFGFELTAVIYAITPAIKDVQGKCVFHYSFNFGMGHVFFVLTYIFSHTLARNICVIHYASSMYFMMAAFMWMQILSFNTWRIARNKIADNSIMKWYYMLGYGIPAFIISLLLLDVYYLSFLDVHRKCYKMYDSLVVKAVILPALIMLLISIFYFLDTQCRMWRTFKSNNEASTFRKIVFRSLLYLKLSAIIGLPWIVLLFMLILSPWLLFTSLAALLIAFICGEGITFFVLMVLLRKKILRHVLRRKYFGREIFPAYCQNVNDSESESMDNDDDGDHDNDVEKTTRV